jgi:D-sedoheptulose 7-phosphate isomerase
MIHIMLDKLIHNYPVLRDCEKDISSAFELMKYSLRNKGLILTCGNGGSAADAEHIVSELMKTFKLKRPLPEKLKEKLVSEYKTEGDFLADNLQCSLPAISLVSQTSLSTAIGNDVSADLVFAQQVIGYGKTGDILFAISTSGNSINILNAIFTAKALEMNVIGLTGRTGGKMKQHCDVAICAPADVTPQIQELHLPIYHTLCAMLEEHFFGGLTTK